MKEGKGDRKRKKEKEREREIEREKVGGEDLSQTREREDLSQQETQLHCCLLSNVTTYRRHRDDDVLNHCLDIDSNP